MRFLHTLAVHCTVFSISALCVYVIVRRLKRDARWRRVTNSCFGSDWSLSYLVVRTMRF